jgi:hypothetical protein
MSYVSGKVSGRAGRREGQGGTGEAREAPTSELSFRKYLNAALANLFKAVAAKGQGHDVRPILGE